MYAVKKVKTREKKVRIFFQGKVKVLKEGEGLPLKFLIFFANWLKKFSYKSYLNYFQEKKLTKKFFLSNFFQKSKKKKCD